MNDLLSTAIDYIEKAAYALLITVSEENKPTVREIGPFANDGLNVYIMTHMDSQKVKHFGINPYVTLYFPNTNMEPKKFKSVAITGTTAYITGETVVNYVLDELGKKSPHYKEYILKEGFDIWGVYRIEPKTLQITDYTNSSRTIKIDL